MKNLISAVLVISCAFAFAIGDRPQQTAPKEHSMTGCLKKGAEADTYMVTDVEGNGPKSIRDRVLGCQVGASRRA